MIRLAVEQQGGASPVSRRSGVARTVLYRALGGEAITGTNARKLSKALGLPLSAFVLR